MRKRIYQRFLPCFMVLFLICAAIGGCANSAGKDKDELGWQDTNNQNDDEQTDENQDVSDGSSDSEPDDGDVDDTDAEDSDPEDSDPENGGSDETSGGDTSGGSSGNTGGGSGSTGGSDGTSGGDTSGGSSGNTGGGSSNTGGDSGNTGGGSDSTGGGSGNDGGNTEETKTKFVVDSSRYDANDRGQVMAKDIVESILYVEMTDFEKLITIHDWLVYNIDYDTTYTNYELEETLRDKKGVCNGYAEAFFHMAKMAGFDVGFVGGTAYNGEATESHAWNRVKLSGTWYNVDVTWDDPTWDGKNANDHSGVTYRYFLISDENLNRNHTMSENRHNAGSCPKDYDRATIYKYVVSAQEGNVGFADGYENVVSQVLSLFEKGNTTIQVWCYDTSLPSDVLNIIWNELLASKYGACFSQIEASSGDGELLKVTVTASMSYAQWSAIPLVTTLEEFNSECEKKVGAGTYSFYIRYEPKDGNTAISITSWTSKYGIKSYRTEGFSYKDGTAIYLHIEFIK